MKRFSILLAVVVCMLAATTAYAQFKMKKGGDVEMTMPDGSKMVVTKDGKLKPPEADKKPEAKEDESAGKELDLGGSSDKKAREKAGPAACEANSDLLVEHKIINGHDTGVKMTGSCDGDVFNTEISDAKTGVLLAGSGELRLTDSEVKGSVVGIDVSGSGDAILENVVIAAPTALRISGTGSVMAKNCKIYGKIVTTGTGKFVDEGANELSDDHTKVPVTPPPAEKPAKKKKK